MQSGLTARVVLAAVTAAAFASVVSACAGGGDKAGGDVADKPLVLTLESEDDLTLSGAPEFAEAVGRLSKDAMRIELVPAGRSTEVAFERGVVEDVREGKAQLGIVGVRVWNTMGVTSFQALLAPFLVDSYELERRVLESPLAAKMLEGVEGAGVVGIAVHPGPLRRPLGLSRALVGPEDYRGMTMGIRPGGVAPAALRALGGAAKGYVPGSLSGLDGVEVDPKTIDYNGWEGVLTKNVVLWPKPYSIVMNREAFAALDSDQRAILFSAGRDALAPELRQTQRDATAAMSEACRHGRLFFVAASSSELAALREAVQPVYDELERDSLTQELIAEIEDLRGELAPAPALPRCAGGAPRAASVDGPLEGRWRLKWTRQELIAAGIPAGNLKGVPEAGTVTYEFRDGRFRTTIPGGRVLTTGSYTVEGDVLNLVYDAPAIAGLVPGQIYRNRWSVFRDSVTFSRVAGSDADLALTVKPLIRIR